MLIFKLKNGPVPSEMAGFEKLISNKVLKTVWVQEGGQSQMTLHSQILLFMS